MNQPTENMPEVIHDGDLICERHFICHGAEAGLAFHRDVFWHPKATKENLTGSVDDLIPPMKDEP